MIVERFVGAFIISIGITLGLFWTMTFLIHVEGEGLPERPVPVVHLVNVIRDSPVELIKHVPPAKPPIVEEPEHSDFDPADLIPDRAGISVPGAKPSDGDRRQHRRPQLMVADGDAAPLVRVPPEYPIEAMRRGVEGRVLVSFTIDRGGSVQGARVIAAEPSNIFNASAIRAVEQWRYAPKIVNGEAVEQRDVRIAIPFKLDGESG